MTAIIHPVMQRNGTPHPILSVMKAQGRRITWLAEVTNYRPEYLSRVFHKRVPATDTVRAKCARVLGLPEGVLFDTDRESAVA